jgi:stalled ribosome rescue protein Dom34
VVGQKKGYRRGYPVAVLTGLDEDRAVMWKVFSNVVKPEKTIWLDGTWNDQKAVYNFLESVINALRPTLKEGVKSIILAAPPRTNYAQILADHIRAHHAWLTQGPNKATFSQTTGSAATPSEVAALARTPQFSRLIGETTQKESENLIDTLEKRLNTTDQHTRILYSLKEIEDLILAPHKPGMPKPDYLMLTDKYIANCREKRRINRLMQIAANKNVRTRIVDAESTAGQRLIQLGGMVCLTLRG